MLQITLKTTKLEKTGKVTYKPIEVNESVITEQIYNNIISAAPFMKRLGGSELNIKSYTCAGYRVVRNISTSPDRQLKSIREFTFTWL